MKLAFAISLIWAISASLYGWYQRKMRRKERMMGERLKSVSTHDCLRKAGLI